VRQRAIRLEAVTLAYQKQIAAADITGSFVAGSLTAVVGPNGAGKTTLLRAIAGLHPLAAGRIDLGGLAPADMGFLPQASRLDRSFPISCREVVATGHWRRVGSFRAITAPMLQRAQAALEMVGMGDFSGRPIGAVSAGQFQRMLFARLIVQDAPVLLLDEPFNAVDPATEAELLAIVHRWHREGRTVVAVLHDLDLVQRDFPQVLLMARKALAWGPTATALAPANRKLARLAVDSWESERPSALTAA
jgi:zinc/manganese transport system ATP-binding protein